MTLKKYLVVKFYSRSVSIRLLHICIPRQSKRSRSDLNDERLTVAGASVVVAGGARASAGGAAEDEGCASLLLCEETIPGSPAPDAEPAPPARAAHLPFACAPQHAPHAPHAHNNHKRKRACHVALSYCIDRGRPPISTSFICRAVALKHITCFTEVKDWGWARQEISGLGKTHIIHNKSLQLNDTALKQCSVPVVSEVARAVEVEKLRINRLWLMVGQISVTTGIHFCY